MASARDVDDPSTGTAAQTGPDWPGLARTGPDWPGLAQNGTVISGGGRTALGAALAISTVVSACGVSGTTSITATPTPTPVAPLGTEMSMVTVRDAGNEADSSGFGRVGYDYRIGKFEVTIGQYAAFLNAVAARDPHGLFHASMATNPNVAGIVRKGAPGSYTYSPIEANSTDSATQSRRSAADRPITSVSWFDAARFANWMSNGRPSGPPGKTTTEQGAYRLAGRTRGTAPAANSINPNTARPPTFRLPTEDEWYKAAYYSPDIAPQAAGELPRGNRTNPNTGQPPAYWIPTEQQWFKSAYFDPASRDYSTFPTAAERRPGNQPGSQPNQANYMDRVFTTTRSADFSFTSNYVTEAGTFRASASHFGTFDQAGNLLEWNRPSGRGVVAPGFRGGAWQNPRDQTSMRSVDAWYYDPISESNVVGFRIAAAPGVPGPKWRAEHGLPRTLSGAETRPATVTIGRPANSADPATDGRFGRVGQRFAIGRFEVTIDQYTHFLNAVAAEDPHGLFNPRMQWEPNLAGISRSGTPGSFRYAVMDNEGNSGNRPIGWVSWYDAARFVNWMANGQPRGRQDPSTTEDGTYSLADTPYWPPDNTPTTTTSPVSPDSRSSPASVAIPSTAAPEPVNLPQRPAAPGAGGYFDYATTSDDPPGNEIGPKPNQVNYITAAGLASVTQSRGLDPSLNYLTPVGSFTGSASPYGTYDQLGNVYEWNDLDGRPGAARGMRGSAYFGTLVYAEDISKLSRADVFASDFGYGAGFRLAGPAQPGE